MPCPQKGIIQLSKTLKLTSNTRTRQGRPRDVSPNGEARLHLLNAIDAVRQDE